MNKIWDKTEVKYLENNYLSKTQKEMAYELNRSELSVNRKMTRLGLKKNDRDITGKRFNRLTAIKRLGKDKYGSIIWEFKCECGKVVEIASTYVIRGKTHSCGCLKKEATREARRVILKGKRFGRAVVIEDTYKTNKEHLFIRKCKCDCGNFFETTGTNLTSGGTKSCGCLRVEMVAEANKKATKKFGKENPNYNHFLTKEEREGRAYIEPGKQVAWRKAVYKKDNYTCQKCNKRSVYLNAHHLNSWASFPESRFDLNNGVALCIECHREFHSIYGIKKNTREQFVLFKQTKGEN